LADEKFMRLAIATAREGIANGQEPFGACIIKGEEVISVAHNTTIEDMDVTAHAEMNAIREACRKLKTTNLSECVIYATFKPCPMCHAACERANISRIYYGAARAQVDSDTVKGLVSDLTNKEAIDYLLGFGMPVAEIYSVKELVNDPHLIERGMFTEVEHPKAGTIKVTNFPVKFSETPGEIQTATPLLGQHNEEILSKILGYTEEQIQNLEKAGVISSDRSN